MTKTSKTILFFGTDDFSALTLTALIKQSAPLGVTIGGVITKPDARKGRGRTIEAPVTKTIAIEHNIPIYQPANSDELFAAVTEASADLEMAPTGVLVSYGRIIPQRVIDLFQPGIINVHPSLLPLYRGPSPVETTVFNGDSETGVSIMQLSAAMDAGPVYTQQAIALDGTETGPALLQSLGTLGAELICSSLNEIIDGSLTPEPQNDSAATYCSLLSKDAALVDPATMTATEIRRHTRAFLDFPKTKLDLAGQRIILRETAVITEEDPASLTIPCANNSYLKIIQLIGPSGKQMSGEAFKNGYLK